MRKIILLGIVSLFSSQLAMAQKSEEKAVKKTVEAFIKAGDQNDVEALDKLLDANYRVVMNRLFGSKEVSVVPRSVYMEKIKSKEWGGDERKIEIQRVTLNGNSANVHVSLTGKKMTFISLLTLVKDGDGNWQLVSDVPMIK